MPATTVFGFAKEYVLQLPFLVQQGDMFAVMISLMLFFLFIIIMNKLTGLFLILIKKTITFVITGFAVYYMYKQFVLRLGSEGLTLNTIIFGVIGVAVGILGLAISFYALFYYTKEEIKTVSKIPLGEQEIISMQREEKQPSKKLQDANFKDFFSLSAVTDDKSLLSVLTFLVVAEFGIFSSKTIAAPTMTTGLTIFLVFLFASFIFIRQSYKEYGKGLLHLIITLIIGIALSILLGYFWANIPLGELFSLSYFKTESLVALISGMALSLFVGSRG